MAITETVKDWRTIVLAFFVLASFVYVLSLAPIPQDLSYHVFADNRASLGITNFFNVMSNAAFLIAGIFGIVVSLGTGAEKPPVSWLTFFIGVFFVSIGSAIYHVAPDNQTLVLDRLPMTVGFMGLFSALIGDYVSPQLGSRLLIPFVATGIGAVVYWHYFDDLRLYAWVQFMPIGASALLLGLFPARYTLSAYLLYALLCYIVAKLFEMNDVLIYRLTDQVVSGHTLKHVFAAAGCCVLALMLKFRKPKIEIPAA